MKEKKKNVPEFERDLRIDKLALDSEWLEQPMLYFEWSADYSQALLERDREKQNLELVRVEIDSNIRKNFEKFGLEKITEAGVANCVIKQKEYQEALEKQLKAVHNANVLSGAIEALNHKKAALDNLTKLFLSGYYTKDVIPKEGRDMVERKVRADQEKGLKDFDGKSGRLGK